MVVDIGTWVKNVANKLPNDFIVPPSPPTMSAKAVLICRPNSHPFQERTLTLDQPVKVGRSIARARGTPTNAIFDCKVLSRHHALLWYENGKFYLQDTKSSNGTFVNNNRLSAGGVESVPHEVCSGDIVQFGVDVVENNRKVTHGCIVATLKLYLHDGKEAKASQSLSVGSSVGSVPLDELYKLNQYLQDALQREQLLEQKLNTLHSLVEQAREATNLSWQAFIGEDRLLSRVEFLETQLLSYSKNYSEDKMREELLKLQEDKSSYQNSAKESLCKVHQERLDAISKLTTLQQTLATTEQEMNVCKEQRAKAQEDLQELAQKYSTSQQKQAELNSKLAEIEQSLVELHKEIETLKQDKNILFALVTELDKCTVNNCPVDLKFRVEKIINEYKAAEKTNIKKDTEENGDEIDHKFDNVDNHKENNVPFSNQTDNNILSETTKDTKRETQDILMKLQDELKQLQDSTEENDNKTQDLDNLRAQISYWTSQRGSEPTSLESNLRSSSQLTLVNEELDNSEYVKRDAIELTDLKQKLYIAQNDIIQKETTITKMAEEVENLLETSALVNAKINLLENDLSEERHNTTKYRKEVEKLKQDLTFSQQLANTTSNETLMMKAKIENLTTELGKRPTVESYEDIKLKCSNLEKILSKQQDKAAGDTNSLITNDVKLDAKNSAGDNEIITAASTALTSALMNELIKDQDKEKLTELEEELVLMKERYAAYNEEKILLNKKIESLKRDCNNLQNRSHNILFLYMAPLILLVAYLLLPSLFS